MSNEAHWLEDDSDQLGAHAEENDDEAEAKDSTQQSSNVNDAAKTTSPSSGPKDASQARSAAAAKTAGALQEPDMKGVYSPRRSMFGGVNKGSNRVSPFRANSDKERILNRHNDAEGRRVSTAKLTDALTFLTTKHNKTGSGKRGSGSLKASPGEAKKKFKTAASKIKSVNSMTRASNKNIGAGSEDEDDDDEEEPEVEKASMSQIELFLRQLERGKFDDERLAEQLSVAKARGTLLPTSTFCLSMNLAIVILIIFYAFVTPMRIAFSKTCGGHFLNSTGVWMYLDFLATAIFVLDIIRSFVTAIEEDGNNDVYIFDRRTIAMNYLKGWFWIDVSGTIPFDLILNAMADIDKKDASFNRLLRLLRLFKLIRILRFSTHIQSLGSEVFNMHILRLNMLLSSLCFMWHYIGCAYWYIATGISDPCYESDFFECVDHWSPWVGLAEDTCPKQYISAFFWALQVTVGIGRDIIPRTTVEMVFTIVMIVIGVLMYSVVIGSVGSSLASLNQVEAAHTQKMDAINSYLSYQSIPKYLCRIVRDYYSYTFKARNALDITSDLPESLKLRLNVASNLELIKQVGQLCAAQNYDGISVLTHTHPFSLPRCHCSSIAAQSA
jgi:hypothetical protein